MDSVVKGAGARLQLRIHAEAFTGVEGVIRLQVLPASFQVGEHELRPVGQTLAKSIIEVIHFPAILPRHPKVTVLVGAAVSSNPTVSPQFIQEGQGPALSTRWRVHTVSSLGYGTKLRSHRPNVYVQGYMLNLRFWF